MTTVLRQFAVYIANLFFLTSDAWAPVVSDAELNEETAEQYNLILVGSPLENSWVEKYHEKVPLKYKDKSLALGTLCYFWASYNFPLIESFLPLHSQSQTSSQ